MAAGREPDVRFEAVDKWFGDQHVLRGIDLEIAPGERLVVCGPSGSGKSTLIRCINGIEPIGGGRLTVHGIALAGDEASARAVRREVGMVFQSFNLFPHLTALENCTLAPVFGRGLAPREAQARARDYLDRVHLGGHADKYPAQLSGGQQQRVAIARALCLEPRLMLFDEPTSALDPEMVAEVLEVMTALAKDGMTMVCVTHEMGFAREVADRIVFMDEGRVVEAQPAAAFFDAQAHERTRRFLASLLR